MATKKRSTSTKRRWKASADDAIRLAALRWFILTFERISIQIYASDRTKYAALERLFRKQMKELVEVGGQAQVMNLADCPDGYFLCRDGLCSPMCDIDLMALAEEIRGQRPR